MATLSRRHFLAAGGAALAGATCHQGFSLPEKDLTEPPQGIRLFTGVNSIDQEMGNGFGTGRLIAAMSCFRHNILTGDCFDKMFFGKHNFHAKIIYFSFPFENMIFLNPGELLHETKKFDWRFDSVADACFDFRPNLIAIDNIDALDLTQKNKLTREKACCLLSLLRCKLPLSVIFQCCTRDGSLRSLGKSAELCDYAIDLESIKLLKS